RSSSSIVRPTAPSSCGHAFNALAVTPPPHGFGSPSGRPSNSATRKPCFASNSAANEPAGPAPTIRSSKLSMVEAGTHDRCLRSARANHGVLLTPELEFPRSLNTFTPEFNIDREEYVSDQGNQSSLVFCGIAPHPPIMVPEVGGDASADVRDSIKAMEVLTARLVDS